MAELLYDLFDVVDKDDVPTGRKATIAEIKAEGLLSRYVQVWLFNSKGQLLIGHRAATRSIRPNLIDTACAGHVDTGEDYEDAAARELYEELKLKLPLEKLLYFQGKSGFAWVFKAYTDEIPEFDKNEMNLISFHDISDLKWLRDYFPYTMSDGFIPAFDKYLTLEKEV